MPYESVAFEKAKVNSSSIMVFTCILNADYDSSFFVFALNYAYAVCVTRGRVGFSGNHNSNKVNMIEPCIVDKRVLVLLEAKIHFVSLFLSSKKVETTSETFLSFPDTSAVQENTTTYWHTVKTIMTQKL